MIGRWVNDGPDGVWVSSPLEAARKLAGQVVHATFVGRVSVTGDQVWLGDRDPENDILLVESADRSRPSLVAIVPAPLQVVKDELYQGGPDDRLYIGEADGSVLEYGTGAVTILPRDFAAWGLRHVKVVDA